ncbi:Vacuolar protein-sorting-associated protein 27 [Apophysomyces ossiformis]|uniref:Vacuolar protein sorting-associated protein 27 n=1 Tax=Apophysomyces ossiformis TaxID=679940 RepID=A0A8H7EPS3_9FUNG|nr:Vacuolar protein-sorting-associated protein 27 [Apophysomyces ossiformis]
MIDRATSELLPAGQEDLVLHFEISDQIRSKKVNAKEAMRSLKRKLAHKNPNVVLSTLSLTDTCVKNGGEQFVKEIASREFMDELTYLLKAPTGCNPDVKTKILGTIQTWGLAAKGNSALGYMSDTYGLLKAEGYVFPPVIGKVDPILFETAAAPEWTDSDVCERCRTPFTMTNRKHHCRQCGGTFCQQCSSKNMPLPHLAINEEVRVCDGCYIKLKLAKVAKKETLPQLLSTAGSPLPSHTPSEPRISKHTTADRNTLGNDEDSFDADMKKAIELSLKEAERDKVGYVPAKASQPRTSPPPEVENEEDDPDLAAAIAASLQDMQVSSSASQSTYNGSYAAPRNDDLSITEMENIQLFATLIERIQAVGGDVSNDTQVNDLYTQIGALQPKLVKSLNDANRKHRTFVELHEKLNRAVKTYDLVLERRVSGAYHRTSDSYNLPYQQYGAVPQAVQAVAAPSVDHASPLYPPVQQASGYYPTQPSSYGPPSASTDAPVQQAPYYVSQPSIEQQQAPASSYVNAGENQAVHQNYELQNAQQYQQQPQYYPAMPQPMYHSPSHITQQTQPQAQQTQIQQPQHSYKAYTEEAPLIEL